MVLAGAHLQGEDFEQVEEYLWEEYFDAKKNHKDFIEKIVELCEKYGIEIIGSVFFKKAEEFFSSAFKS